MLVEIWKLKEILGRAQKEESCAESLYHSREYIYYYEQNVAKNMNIKSPFGEVSDRNEDCVTGNWRSGDPFYTVTENLAEMCSVEQKGELVSNELRHLAKGISKQSVEGTAWFLLVDQSKTQEERDKLKKELLNKKKPHLEDSENSHPIHIAKDAKNEKACSGENSKGVACESNEPSQQKP